MKRNAVIRIVIWSIVIVLLGAILLAGLRFNPFRYRRASSASNSTPTIAAAANPTTAAAANPTNAAAETQTTASTAGKASQETQAAVEPASGLVLDGAVSIPANQIRDIDIEWFSGFIQIQSADITEIQFSESSVSDIKYAMQWKQKDGKLTIKFCEAATWRGFFSFQDLSKDLTIYVPRDWTCNSLDIDAASSTLEVTGLTIREVEIDSASGTCTFNDCQLDEIDLDTASGDVRITGTLNILECDAASASVYAVLDNVPNRIKIDSMSGGLDLTLPPDAGFTVKIDSMSSDFSSDFATTQQNGSYICGNGSCRIDMNGMSGDVVIRKGQ